VMPHMALLTLNATAIIVGLMVMADPPPTWLSAAWAAMHVVILSRMVIEAVAGGRAVDDAGAHEKEEQNRSAVGVASVPSMTH
jgi:hypothetical protein